MLLLLACVRAPSPAVIPPAVLDPAVPDPASSAYHRAAEAEALRIVPDSARGGAPVGDGASPLPPFGGVRRDTARYVGSSACGACHPTVLAQWSETAHARSMDTLLVHKAAYNPDCFRCHVTGYGHPGGYLGAATPALAQVGCESCHGPGSDHIGARTPGYGALPASGAACVACHAHDNSPDFRFDLYWPRVAHPG